MEPLKEKSRHLKASEPFVFIPIDADENTDECPKIRTAIALKKLGNTHFENKRFIDALVCYRDAIEQLKASDKKKSAKELAICYQNSAAVLEHGKRYEECIEIATTAIELNASYAKAYYRRARCHIQLKNQYFALQDIVQACILERFQNSTYNKIAAKTNRQFGEHFIFEIMNFDGNIHRARFKWFFFALRLNFYLTVKCLFQNPMTTNTLMKHTKKCLVWSASPRIMM